jgi:hypothetical protein
VRSIFFWIWHNNLIEFFAIILAYFRVSHTKTTLVFLRPPPELFLGTPWPAGTRSWPLAETADWEDPAPVLPLPTLEGTTVDCSRCWLGSPSNSSSNSLLKSEHSLVLSVSEQISSSVKRRRRKKFVCHLSIYYCIKYGNYFVWITLCLIWMDNQSFLSIL